jgi:hypothetical protein
MRRTTMWRETASTVVALLFGILGGCDSGTMDYDVVLRNAGTNEINGATVRYGSFVSVGGVLPPGIEKAHLLPEVPIPPAATVQWRTSDGVLHQQEVEVKRLVPAKFRGEIYFVIDSSNRVTVVAEPDPYR